jgi:hypothetical protein
MFASLEVSFTNISEYAEALHIVALHCIEEEGYKRWAKDLPASHYTALEMVKKITNNTYIDTSAQYELHINSYHRVKQSSCPKPGIVDVQPRLFFINCLEAIIAEN